MPSIEAMEQANEIVISEGLAPAAPGEAMIPTLTLHRRTPGEQRAWYEGARLALTLVLQRLPGAVAIPPTGHTGAEIDAACREVLATFHRSEAAGE